MTPRLTEEAIEAALPTLEGWSHEGDALTREVVFRDFKEALASIVHIGLVADQDDHHPEIHNVYNRVRLTLRTHDAGGVVTARDLHLARRIDEVLRARGRGSHL